MACTTTWGYTNVTPATHAALQLTDLGLMTNYGVTNDDANNVTLVNKTAPLSYGEKVQIFDKDLDKVNTVLSVPNPDVAAGAHRFTIRNDAILRSVYDDGKVVDTPVVCQLILTHQLSDNLTATHLSEIVARTVSAIFKEDGSNRLDDYARGALKPAVN